MLQFLQKKGNHVEFGMIGRIGTSMVRRLLRGGHQRIIYDPHPEGVRALVKEGAVGTISLEGFTHKLKKPRAAKKGGAR